MAAWLFINVLFLIRMEVGNAGIKLAKTPDPLVCAVFPLNEHPEMLILRGDCKFRIQPLWQVMFSN